MAKPMSGLMGILGIEPKGETDEKETRRDATNPAGVRRSITAGEEASPKAKARAAKERIPKSLGAKSVAPDKLPITGVELLRRIRERATQPFVLEPWLAPGAVTMWAARLGSAKSWMAHRLAWNLSQGLPFLGLYPPRPLRVLYVDLENPGLVKEDLLTFMPPEATRGRLVHVYMDHKLARTAIRQPGYDLIIIDNLQSNRNVVVDEKANSEAHVAISLFKEIAHKNNCAFLLLYNTGKGKGYTKELGPFASWLIEPYKSRGASEYEDRVDEVMNLYPTLEREDGKDRMFTHLGVVKGRLGGRGFYYKARWLDEADYELAAHTKLLGTSRQEQLAERAIDLIRVGEQQDTQAIREALGVEPQSAEDRALRRGLDKRAVTDRAKITTNHPLLLVNDGEAGGKGGGGTSRVYERVR